MATGAMFLVIATVLVSGVGGAALISSNDTATAQANEVVNDTLSTMCNGLAVVDVTGRYVNNSMIALQCFMRLSPGSHPVDMEGVTILVSNETGESVYALSGALTFSASVINGNGDMVVDKGELLKLTVPLGPLPVGEEVVMKLVVENGQILVMRFTVPDSQGNQFVMF